MLNLFVFAFSFGAPALLWGLALSATPIIIHLLSRRRYKIVDWAAMRWLLEAVRKNYRRFRIEQLLLLAIRTIIILLIVFAMARPVLEGTSLLASAVASGTHNILVFDNSLSMQFKPAGQSRWERAKGVAQSILDGSSKGDLASVVVMGAAPNVLVGDPSPYLSSVTEEIDGIKPEHTAGRIEPAIDKVLELLQLAPGVRKSIYLITDLQRSAWSNADQSEELAGLTKKLQSASAQARFNIVNVGAKTSPNVAIVNLETAEPLVVRNRSGLFRAQLANYSDQPHQDLRVELLVDGQIEATERVTIPPNEQRTVHLGIVFREAGDRIVEVRLPDDGLQADNHRWVSVQVREQVSVLLVDGEPSGEPFRSEADYLRVAFAPEAAEERALFRTEVIPESDLLSAPLDQWDLVVLCNVGQLTPTEDAVLRSFLRGGGGLLTYFGSQTNLQAYDETAYQEGKGWLPLKPLALVGETNQTDQFFSFDPRGYRHPVVKVFENAEQSGLLTTKVFRYVRGQLPADSSAEVALAYQSGDPAIVLNRYGSGRTAVVTTSADLDWNTWAISPSYVPVVHELARLLVAGRVQRTSVLAGEPLVVPVPARGIDATVTVIPPEPNAAPVSVVLEEGESTRYVRLTETELSGVYRAKLTGPSAAEIPLAVNPPPSESDLAALSAEDLTTMFPGWEFRLRDDWQTSDSAAATHSNRPGELFRILLYAGLVLLFVETLLAWRFARH